MDPLTLGLSFGASAAGRLFGGNSPQMPSWVIDMLKEGINRDRATMFTPNRKSFDAYTKGNIDYILSKLPVATEQFNAGLASRGIYSSGEAPKHYYSDVVAPIQANANQAAYQGQMGYESLAMQGRVTAEQQRNQLISMLLSSINPDTGGMDRLMGMIGELGDFGTKLSILKELKIL